MRVEERTYTALCSQEVLDESQCDAWENLSSLIQVDRLVTLSDGTERHEKQYYLSSLPAEAVEKISSYIRGHWGIENRLHWHLDVTFREDHCRARKEYAATNLNTIRKLALAIVSQQKDKLSLRKRLFKAGPARGVGCAARRRRADDRAHASAAAPDPSGDAARHRRPHQGGLRTADRRRPPAQGARAPGERAGRPAHLCGRRLAPRHRAVGADGEGRRRAGRGLLRGLRCGRALGEYSHDLMHSHNALEQ